MNFFVHGCLIGTAETSSNLSLDPMDNPIIPIQLSWLSPQAVENIVRKNFRNGSSLLENDFFLRLLTLAGGNARLLECLKEALGDLQAKNPTASFDNFQKELLPNWIQVAERRFSVNGIEWSTSTHKMALLLAITGIPVTMNFILDLPTPNVNVFESLDLTNLEKNGLLQRRALPDTSSDQPYNPIEQYVLQLSPLIASMIILKST